MEQGRVVGSLSWFGGEWREDLLLRTQVAEPSDLNIPQAGPQQAGACLKRRHQGVFGNLVDS